MRLSNVVEMNFGNVYEDVKLFLDSQESENTRIRYEREIKRFISWKFKKPIQQVKECDINSLDYTDMLKYRNYLRRKYSRTTTNGAMYAIYSLLKTLKKVKRNNEFAYSLDIESLRLKPLNETDKEEYGHVEWEEMDEWIDYLKSLPKRQNPDRKAAFIQLARITGIRKQGLSNLKFKDLKKEDGVWTLTHTLKGKKRKVSISNKDAQMLLDLKITNDPNEKILKMSTKTMERTFNQIKKHFNIPKERNIVLHSIRGASGYEAYLASGKDMLVAQTHLGHEDIRTTYNYIKQREEIQMQPTLYMGKNIDNNDVKDLTSEDWSKVFNNLSRSAKYEILHEIKELGIK